MKVLHVIDSLGIGGTQRLMVDFVATMRNTHPEIENHVCVLRGERLTFEAFKSDVSPTYLDFSGQYRNLSESKKCIKRLRRLIQELKPDIVHSYLWISDVFSAMAIKDTNARHVAYIVDRRADRYSPRMTQRIKVLITSHLYRKADTRFVAVSEACKEHAAKHYKIDKNKILVAHNSIKIKDYEGNRAPSPSSDNESFVIGTISNFEEEKGHRFLIQAVAKLKDANPRLKLIIAGDGRLKDEHEKLVKDLESEQVIDFIGRVAKAQDLYRQIHAFVIPSIYAEGLPTTIIEAMACGLPIVATDVGGAVEAVRNTKEAILVEPKDVDALAEAIIWCMEHPDKTEQMGKLAHKRACTHFAIENMARSIVDNVYTKS